MRRTLAKLQGYRGIVPWFVIWYKRVQIVLFCTCTKIDLFCTKMGTKRYNTPLGVVPLYPRTSSRNLYLRGLAIKWQKATPAERTTWVKRVTTWCHHWRSRNSQRYLHSAPKNTLRITGDQFQAQPIDTLQRPSGIYGHISAARNWTTKAASLTWRTLFAAWFFFWRSI